MSEERLIELVEPTARQTAFSVEQMAPGGIERAGAGVVRTSDLRFALGRLERASQRASEESRQRAVRALFDRTAKMLDRVLDEGASGLIYLAPREFALSQRLRSAAIEVDFCFGDKDGVVSLEDIREARRRYGAVRGPVGWNRLLLTDEIERHLFPERTLRSTEGLRLLPEDWLVEGSDPLLRLRKVMLHLDDNALARTYADVAARLATVASHTPNSDLREIFEAALLLLGGQILARNGVRPTITDIARIGCEDPEVKAHLRTPIEMSRKLQISLIERYLTS